MAKEETELAAQTAAEKHAGLYLTFTLEEETYGLPILLVQEIIQLAPITAIPRAPEFIRGIINLRGKVIPVVDLRRKFKMAQVQDTPQTCIVVVEVSREEKTIIMGIVVDHVAEVLNVPAGQIDPPPSFGLSENTEFILGMGKVGDKIIMLLDISRVLLGDDLEAVASLSKKEIT